MAFRFQLTCGRFLLMPRGPTAAEILPSNVNPYFRRDTQLCVVQGFIFTKDVLSSSSLFFACFDMEGLFVVISRLSFDYVV
jgi:hypothetical protein